MKNKNIEENKYRNNKGNKNKEEIKESPKLQKVLSLELGAFQLQDIEFSLLLLISMYHGAISLVCG